MRQLEARFVATVQATKIRNTFNLFATDAVLGVFVGIAKLLTGIPMLYIRLEFPPLLEVTVGSLLLVHGRQGITAGLVYLLLFTGFSILLLELHMPASRLQT